MRDICPHPNPIKQPCIPASLPDGFSILSSQDLLPRGTTVNANHIVGALGNFMKVFKKNRLEMAVGEWFTLT